MNELSILNINQAYFYVENGVQPVRIECGRNNKIVYIFTKEETQALYTQWLDNAKWKRKEIQA